MNDYKKLYKKGSAALLSEIRGDAPEELDTLGEIAEEVQRLSNSSVLLVSGTIENDEFIPNEDQSNIQTAIDTFLSGGTVLLQVFDNNITTTHSVLRYKVTSSNGGNTLQQELECEDFAWVRIVTK